MLKREPANTQPPASTAPQEVESKKQRRCQALKDDGTVCSTILTRYNVDPYVCFSCAQRYAKRGLKPVYAADFRPKSTGKRRGKVPKKATSAETPTDPVTLDALPDEECAVATDADTKNP